MEVKIREHPLTPDPPSPELVQEPINFFLRGFPFVINSSSWTFTGAGLSIIAALSMVFLFGMELSNYLAVGTTTSIIIVYRFVAFLPSHVSLLLWMLVTFWELLNMTKTECKFSIDGHLNPTGTEFHPGPIPKLSNHGDEVEEEFGDRSLPLTAASFDKFAYQFPVWLLIFMPLGVIGVIT